MKKKNSKINTFFINVSRAAEVALTGSHTMCVIAPLDYINAKDDYELIIKPILEKNGVVLSSAETADVVVEISAPKNPADEREFESFSESLERVSKALTITTLKKTDSMEQLLKHAATRLTLPVSRCEKVYDVAHSIAKLDRKKSVGVEHVAEAIHYCAAPRIEENYQDLTEEGTFHFGPGIAIKNIALHPSDIENALKYLRDLHGKL